MPQPKQARGQTPMQIINDTTELTDVRNLRPHPKNPNRGNADLIAESIHENGFYGQIIAQRSTGHVLVGHHRLQAAQQLGAAQVPVTWVDVDDTRALKIMLADNRTAEQAHRDETALAELLAELNTLDSLTGTGYSADDLGTLIEELAPPDFQPSEEAPPRLDEKKRCTCPECGHEFTP